MKIHGLQKLTLLDYPSKVACTVFIAGCNMRCPFCHNFELVEDIPEAVCDDKQLLSFLEKRKGMLDGVCLTGGEPLLNPGTPELMRAIKEMGYSVKLDTNGTSPGTLARVIEKGLCDYVAMDIKNSRERYAVTAGVEYFDTSPVEECVRLLASGDTDYELRTTVVRELLDEDSFRDIAEFCAGAKRFVLQSFVDRDTVRFSGLSAPDADELARYKAILSETIGDVSIRGV